MLFDAITCTILEHLTAEPPLTEDAWYGPWNTILMGLFPSSQGYIVTPQQCLPSEDQTHIPDFIIEVIKLSTTPLTFRTVLINEIKNTQHWPGGIQSLKHQLARQTDSVFSGTAKDKVYWIGVIGSHGSTAKKSMTAGSSRRSLSGMTPFMIWLSFSLSQLSVSFGHLHPGWQFIEI
jgi:hypothetical protein